MGISAISASITLNLTFRMGSSHRGPSQHPTEILVRYDSSRTEAVSCTSADSVSSIKTFGPRSSGPKDQIFRAARISNPLALKVLSSTLAAPTHLYLFRLDIFRNTLVQRFRDHLVLLVRCLGVAFQRRRLRNCFSKTYDRIETLISISEYIRLRSCITQSMYISPVPKITCSPHSSTLVRRRG